MTSLERGPSSESAGAASHGHPVQNEFPNNRWATTSDSFLHKLHTHGAKPFYRNTVNKFIFVYKKSVNQIESLYVEFSLGNVPDLVRLMTVSSESIVGIMGDLDLFVGLGMTPAIDKYLCKHSLQTAMLAMSIGTVMGLKRDELIELGVGCLIRDAGMLFVDSNQIGSRKVFNQIEFLEITKHPTLTFELIKHIKDLPNGVRMVAYQMDERCDGFGYPRQRQGNQIHHLAKIAAVADAFVAMFSPRPHRPGLLPYCDMEQVIRDSYKGLFDRNVVMGLLHTVSLFPIGSSIEVSDGRFGKVVRSNRDCYTKPVVQLWMPNQPRQGTEIIDLSREPELVITRAVTADVLPTL